MASGGVCTLQHNVDQPPSAFFVGPKNKFVMFGLPWIGFDLQENIDTFWESIRVNPYMNLQQDVWYVLFYVLAWIVLRVVWQQFVIKPLAVRFLPKPTVSSHPEKHEVADGSAQVLKASNEDNGLHQRKHAPNSSTTSMADAKKRYENQQAKKASDTMSKFLTAGWRSFGYELLFIGGMYVWMSHDWWYPSWQWFHGWPHCMEWDVRQFFCLYFAFYISETIFIFYEPKMKDRPVMLLHHFATMGLILLSYLQGHYRIALPVMILHDLSDPLMEFAKLLNYCDVRVRGIPMADALFVIFALAFFVTRLGFFPVYVIASVLWEATFACEYCNGLYIWLVFFGVLLILHVFWSSLILRMIMDAIVNKKVPDDIREDE